MTASADTVSGRLPPPRERPVASAASAPVSHPSPRDRLVASAATAPGSHPPPRERLVVSAATAPGTFLPPRDRWGAFGALCRSLPEGSLVVLDRRVARLHPAIPAALARKRPLAVVQVAAGEGAKSFVRLEALLARGAPLPRSGTLLAIGGGTVGDLATVTAHLLKRGVRLVHVPTTLLAAVDSSVGGKGAVHVGRVKNGAGAFHYAAESWLCPEVFTTLSGAQRREGLIEAWKMALCLDRALHHRLSRRDLSMKALITAARARKAEVCGADPYERTGRRAVLNFGHTLGHALESLSGFRLSHGDAVGVGMLCALDVGRLLGVMPPRLAGAIEQALQERLLTHRRPALARILAGATDGEALALLRADKKVDRPGVPRMVLLHEPGDARVHEVPVPLLRGCVRAWRRGVRP